MAKFVVNSRRYDPYKNFKFRVRIDGKPVGAVTEVSSLVAASKKSKIKLTGLRKFFKYHHEKRSVQRNEIL